jgi:putative membrane protein
MKRASDLFPEGERQKIADAVTEAEKNTSGEIVPVVATSSGRYDRAEDTVGFLMALLFFLFSWWLFQEVTPVDEDWKSGSIIAFGPVMSVITLVVGFVLGTALATLFPVLRLPFIPELELTEEVERAAAEAFQKFRLRKTIDSTGILIYVSLFEHTVRVIGDDAIAAKLDHSEWETVARLITDGLRLDRPTGGLSQGIGKCGELLSAHFPRKADDVNELPNELIVID